MLQSLGMPLAASRTHFTMSSVNYVPLVNEISVEFTPPVGYRPSDGVSPSDVTVRFREKTGPGAWVSDERCFPHGAAAKWVTKFHELKPATTYEIEFTINGATANDFGEATTWVDPGSRRLSGIQWNVNSTRYMITVSGAGTPGSWAVNDDISTTTMTSGTIRQLLLDGSGNGYIVYSVETGSDIQAAETITNNTVAGSPTATIDTTHTLPATTFIEFDGATFGGTNGGQSTPDLFNWQALYPSGALSAAADGRVEFDCSNLTSTAQAILIDGCPYFIMSGIALVNAPGNGIQIGSNNNPDYCLIDDCRTTDWGSVIAEGWNTSGEVGIGSVNFNATAGTYLMVRYCHVDYPRGDGNLWNEWNAAVAGGDISDGDAANISKHAGGADAFAFQNPIGPTLFEYNTLGDPDLPKYRQSSFRFDPHDTGSVDTTNDIIIDNSDGTNSYGDGIANLSTGDPVYLGVTRDGVLPTGLSAQTIYYIRKVTTPSVGVTLHPTASDATNNTNKVDITALGTDGSHSGTETSIGASTWFPNAQVNGGKSFRDGIGGRGDDESGVAGAYSTWKNNDVNGCSDDALECEGFNYLVTLCRNRCNGALSSLGAAPIFKGPMWIYSNLSINLARDFVRVDSGRMTKIEPSGAKSNVTPTDWFHFQTDITDVTDASTGSASLSHDNTNDLLVFNGAGDGTAIATKTLTSTSGTQDDQILLAIPAGGSLRLKLGTSSGGTQIADVTFAGGFLHRLEFNHTATTFYVQLEYSGTDTAYLSHMAFGLHYSWLMLAHNTLDDNGRLIQGLTQGGRALQNVYAVNNIGKLGSEIAVNSPGTTTANRHNYFDYCDYETTATEANAEQTAYDNTVSGSAYGANFTKGTITYDANFWPTSGSAGYQNALTTGPVAALQHRHTGSISKGILPLLTNSASADEYGHNYGVA